MRYHIDIKGGEIWDNETLIKRKYMKKDKQYHKEPSVVIGIEEKKNSSKHSKIKFYHY